MTTKIDIKTYDLFIDGFLRSATGEKYLDSINPSTGEVFSRIADATIDDIKKAVFSARQAFDEGIWPTLSLPQRGIYLKKIAEAIRDCAKELAELETLDTGKTSKQTTFIDVPTCADTFEYFSNITKELDSHKNPVEAPVESVTVFEPMGVVGCIIPWNYPLIMFAWKVAPALMAGNTIVFKPSRQASVSIMRLSQIIKESGLPEGVINIVSTSSSEVAAQIIKSPDVDMVSFTGGTETGKKIMGWAAQTTKKISLELGGKSPNIVFSDCDFEAALGGTMSAIFMNQGQMCTAGSRLLVEEPIYDKFLGELVKKTKQLTIGPASEPATQFGPLISREHRDDVLKAIKSAVKEGATLACGGQIPDNEELKNGFYLEPTILTDVNNSMNIAQEEVFGPVLAVIKFSDIDEAVKIANDSPYGLASCVWTKDQVKAQDVAGKLQCGTVWINTYGGFYSQASFGGYKQSGFGRELGVEGLKEYTQSKHICVDQTPGGKPLAASWF